MSEMSGRMRRVVRDLVLEARRSGYKMADVRFEAASWNDERDVVFSVLVPEGGLTILETEEV